MLEIIQSGIIIDSLIIKLDNNKILPYLGKLTHYPEAHNLFTQYKNHQLIKNDQTIINFFVQVKNYIVIKDTTVYYSSKLQPNLLDKLYYVNHGYRLKMLRYIETINNKLAFNPPVELQEQENIAAIHSRSKENELSYWFEKTCNLGFRVPKTAILFFSNKEIQLIKSYEWAKLSKEEITKRAINVLNNSNLNIHDDMFMRLGIASNKFNFESCIVHGIDDLYSKLMQLLSEMIFRIEYNDHVELVLREYIKPSYSRPCIYNGMPLNTEFRVFYDFDLSKVLGICNYWDQDTMLDNLHNSFDLLNFAKVCEEINKDFNTLKPRLYDECSKLSKCCLNGKWSVDFMYDGNNFILIDMAHAECSYYYDKVLNKNFKGG